MAENVHFFRPIGTGPESKRVAVVVGSLLFSSLLKKRGRWALDVGPAGNASAKNRLVSQSRRPSTSSNSCSEGRLRVAKGMSVDADAAAAAVLEKNKHECKFLVRFCPAKLDWADFQQQFYISNSWFESKWSRCWK